MYLRFFSFLFIFLISACSTLQAPAPVRAPTYSPSESFNTVPQPLPAYYTLKKSIQCVPHAREVSGIKIYGDAYTWWNQAAAKNYKRGKKPSIGAVLVLSKTSRLKYGHVGVVQNIINSREIRVAHSNWGGDRTTRRYIYRRMPAIDVSPNNDWSEIRFWDYPSGTYGSVYKASGFIYPKNNR